MKNSVINLPLKDWEPSKGTEVRSDPTDMANLAQYSRVVNKVHTIPKLEVKSIGGFTGFYGYLNNAGAANLAAYQALNYFSNVSILSDAISDITGPAKKVSPVWYNPKKKDWVTEHESLNLLNNPGGGMSGSLYKEFWLTNKLITGNAFTVATGDRRNAPLELLIGYAQDMVLQSDNKGFLWKILQNGSASTGESYTRDDTALDNTFRYYTQDGQKELLVTRSFNTRFSVNNQWGMSPLKPLMYELEQFISQNMHNDSLLKRGASPSLLFSAEGELSGDQYNRLNDMINDYYSGPMNAGKPILGENNMSVNTISQTNKDLEFDKLISSLTARVYNTYEIPLPSVMAEQMTLANLESSRLMKYDDAVLPALDEFHSEHTTLLQPRYKDLEGYHLTYDADQIEALEPRRLANATAVNKLNILSTNEQRTTYLKREPVPGAGDDILVPANMLPLSRDQYTEDENEESAGVEETNPRSSGAPTQTNPPNDDEEIDPIEEDDAEKFIASVTRTLKCSKEEALKKAVQEGMFKDDDGVENLDRFYLVAKRSLEKTDCEGISLALKFGMFGDLEDDGGI